MTTIKTANRPKVSDIAQVAGVSPATVSKVINGRDGVSDETRDRVELLLEEAGFRKKLPTTKTMRSIELVVNEMTNNGSVEMVKETTSYARDFGIGITVSCAGPDFKEYATRNETSNCLRSAIERNPLGVILLLSNISSAEESLLQTRNIPYVIVDPVGQVSADALGVGIDNWTGGECLPRNISYHWGTDESPSSPAPPIHNPRKRDLAGTWRRCRKTASARIRISSRLATTYPTRHTRRHAISLK